MFKKFKRHKGFIKDDPSVFMANDAFTVGHYIFDKQYHDDFLGGSDIKVDVSGNGKDLTPTGFAADYAGSLNNSDPLYDKGKALTFDGTTQYFNSAIGALSFTASDKWTCEFWINPTVGPNNFLMIFGDTSGAPVILIQKNTASDGYLRFRDDASTYHTLSSSTAITYGQWHYVVYTYDGSTNTMTAFINGVKQLSVTVSSIMEFRGFGDGYTGTSLMYYGDMAEVRISNKVRSDLEISNYYAKAVA